MTAALLSLLLAAPPRHEMNESLVAALDRALAGDAEVLHGLGIEEDVLAGPSWEDRLTVDGTGRVTFSSRRAPGDRGGIAIGLFGTRLEKADMQSLLRAVRGIVAAPPAPARAEVYETRVVLSVVVGGYEFGFATVARPPSLEPLGSLLDVCGRAQARAMEAPVRSLALVLEAPAGVVRGGPTPLVLHLSNGGSEGAWVSNPLALPNEKGRERAELVYARPRVLTPGVTPVPMPPGRAPLVPGRPAQGEPRYRWVPPGGEISAQVQAAVEPPADAKVLVLRAALFLDEGLDEIAGKPRIRGSLFSADLTAPIR